MISFDNSPILYQIGGLSVFILVIFLSFIQFTDSPKLRKESLNWAIVALQLILLIYLRLPAIVFNEALNLDESVFIVGAMTLAESPLYWQSVDGCTSGPLNFYILTIFCEFFKQPYDYISARIVGIALLVGSFTFSFLAIKRLFSATVAALSIYPAVIFLGLTKLWDFVHFSSEQLPIFLLSILLYIYAMMYRSETPIKSAKLFVFGFIAGCVTFTKLQAIPIAFGVTLATFWLIYYKKEKKIWQQLVTVFTGGCLPIFILVLIGYYNNLLEKMWISYISNNFSYGNKSQNILKSIYLSLNDPTNFFIRITLLLAILALGYRFLIQKQWKLSPLGILLFFFTACTIISVNATGLIFDHYLLFLIFPSVFLFALLLNDILRFSKKNWVLYSLFILSIGFVLKETLNLPLGNSFISSDKPQRPLSITKTGQQILKYSYPNESLVVWGEAGHLYLETKRTQGIRWSNTLWGMYSDSLQKNFQREFVAVLKEKPFPIFIDAHTTKNTFMARSKCGYETHQELKEHIDNNYKLIGEFDEQRLFVHNERLIEIEFPQ
jgi:hypothetical protein